MTRAAFINAIAEEGTKAEAVEWLQKIWDERCALQDALNTCRELRKYDACEIRRLKELSSSTRGVAKREPPSHRKEKDDE